MKRFYREAEAGPHESGFVVLLDGRPVKTPARHDLAVPSPALARALAAEWAAQEDEIRPATMRLTRLASTALDRVADARDAVAAEIAR
jgi:chaperone required for assembly of F1-ATPase